ncbi:MAG: 50S ribosomal protein L11 methyltransferase [Paramuribaculum sp.]|nr:50S ribosomal protein L11 methyltransferase [Paramuribaculum sp.]
MNDYIEARFEIEPCQEMMTDILADILAARGFESFVPDRNGLTAYIRKEIFEPHILDITDEEWFFDATIKSVWKVIEGQDWNSEWEKNYFQPIVIDGRCVIHSSFHSGYPACEYDIVIDPKMAFGTGHHATTALIVRRLLDLKLNDKKIIDMGTGTGILAILARKLGANPVIAVEIDPPAYENTLENIVVNGCGDIDVRLGDVSAIADEKNVDLFVANINRNVILGDIEDYKRTLRPGSMIILSGFLVADIPVCTETLAKLGFCDINHTVDGDWAAITAILSEI